MMLDLEKLQANLQRELDSLRQTRDELHLQLSLAKADARSEWNELEARMRLAQEEVARVSAHAKTALQQIEDGSRKLIQELKLGYEHLRERLDGEH